MKNLSIKSQFYLGAAIILLFCCVGASWYQYQNMQNQALSYVYAKTEIYLTTAASIRSYVKDVLRPKIQETLSSDQFILEAMSTSYISRQIMNKLKISLPDLNYRRAAINPRNPGNLADSFETDMMHWFDEHPEEKQWQGMIHKNGSTSYVRMMPIRAEKPCLTCHGRPEDAPEELQSLYGTEQSFGYVVGDIVGADTIYIPMDKTNLQIKEKTAWVFVFGFISLFSLFALFALLFNRTVIQQLKKLLLTFRALVTDKRKEMELFDTRSHDEVEQIKFAFEKVAESLKQMHDELTESEEKYKTLFQASPDTIFVCNTKGGLTDLNEAGMELFEVDELNDYLSNAHFTQLFVSIEEGSSLFSLIRDETSVTGLEHIMVTEKGKQLICSISAKRLLNDQNEFNGIEGVIRDVTEEKKLNKHLAQTERLASIGQLAAGVAHEINNPLGVILCYGDLIVKNNQADPQIRDDTEVIRKHATICKTIVESLLNFARVSETNMKKTNIHACLQEILSVLNSQMKKRNIIVSHQFDSQVEKIVLDESKIKQVFMNLLLNSIQAMPDGGKLNIKTKFDELKKQIMIDVVDTGRGIPDETLDRIFEPFFTTKKRGYGTGLGLSVSYGIIRQHNGEITVSTKPGSGTTFSIFLPINNGETQNQKDGLLI
jgi:two-component system, NtrC family, sensor kinase